MHLLCRTRTRAAALILGAVGLASCGVRPGPGSVEPPPPRLVRDLPGASGAERAGHPLPADNPTGSLTLRDALALTLLQSPELAAQAWTIRAQEARSLQEGRRPNPAISVMVEDFGATGSLAASPNGSARTLAQTTIQLGQVVELGGKRTARWRLADQERILSTWDYEITRLRVLTEAAGRFVTVLADQALVSLADQAQQSVDSTLQTVVARVAAGAVSPMEQVRAEVALAEARLEAERARAALAVSRRALAASWGSVEAQFGEVAGDLARITVPPPLASLEGRLAAAPELGRWAATVVQRERTLGLARARRLPDIELIAGLRRFEQESGQAYLLGVSLRLPLFDANGGAIQEAASRLAGTAEARRAATIETHLTLARLHADLADAHAEATALQAQVLPGARQAFATVREGYRLGRFGYLDVLETQRTVLNAERRSLRALERYHHAVAALERLLGERVASSTTSLDPSGKE